MSETETIQSAPVPATLPSLIQDLRTLGVQAGQTVLVHTSLSALGWVCGGPMTVVLALEEVLGPTGTLVMPAHSGDWSDPGQWQRPPVPETWWSVIRETMPAFDPALTPTRKMGVVAECFRTQPGTLRSVHPQDSFAARGPLAAWLIQDHRLESGLGEHSPLARLYDVGAWVLLLGVGHGNNTSLHLAESRAQYAGKRWERQGAPLQVNGQRQWVWFETLAWDDADFVALGDAFGRETGWEVRGTVARAEARWMPQPALVDYAVQWLERERRG